MRLRRILPLFVACALLIGVFGCDIFTGVSVTPLQVTLYVNEQVWAGGLQVEARPDYSIPAVVLRFDVTGGDSDARYRVEYVTGVTGREEWFDASATIRVTTSQTITIRSGRATPVIYELTVINNAPYLYSAWISDVQPEMGALLRIMVEYHDPNTCPSVAAEQITGAYDEDSALGDTLTYRLRITGPKKGSWQNFVQYRLYNDLPGTNEYEILTDQWLPVETQTYFFVGYDGPAPGIGALGCYPDPDEPFNTENPWPSGKNLCVEQWVRDSMGAEAYRRDYWEIYVGGCP